MAHYKNKIVWSEESRGIFFLLLVLAIFFSYEMGNRHFAYPDEGRYIEISREMVASGDFVTPKLNGLKYFEKPPLFYWMQAGAIKIFGINETSMRLWTVIFAVLGCLGVFLIGAKCYSGTIGLMSSAILATNILYYAHSRLIILDLVTSVLMSGTLWCFFYIFVKENRRKSVFVAMYVFSALACLAKGLIGVVLPAFIICLWMVFTKNWSKIKKILYIPGILIFLIIFLPWHVLAAMRNDGFLYFYFIVEHFLRYTTTIHHRYQPFWFFVPILLVGFMPWTGFSLVAIKNSFKKIKDSENVFLMCWIFGILGFFSFSNSKLIPYILPILPPIALITAITLMESFDLDNGDFKWGVITNIILSLLMIFAYSFAKSEIKDLLRDPDVVLLIKIFMGLFVAAAIVLISSLYFRISKIIAMLVYVFISANIMWVINSAAVFYQNTKKPTTKYIAETLNINRRKGDLIFCYKRYYSDFSVYLNSMVGVVDFIGEFEFGAKVDPNNDKLITEKEFWKLWNTTNRRIFLLLSREYYREVFAMRNLAHRIVDLDKYFTLIANK
ncbi:MAG: glycosyltransferase family 39 protein [Holosporaceae bacterium]|jgi:4-amino-4-deoxy-L-arabinose transferase-like glycosyltransferase|nr:glycosyltransferase family 39 protein [Holosporaceae bacterium]